MNPTNDHAQDRHRSVRAIARLFEDRVRRAARAELPAEAILLWGEVLAVDEGDRVQHIVLLDRERDDLVLDATLPAEVRLSVGEMICMEGRLEERVEPGAVLRLVLRGTRIVESKGFSARVNMRRRLLAELDERSSPPRRVEGPVRAIALVTSPASKGRRDFERVLRRGATEPPTIALVPVKLTDAADVARGIREAERMTVDLIVVLRGGGSAFDLYPFSTPDVARAVAEVAALVPTMLAVGHAEDVVVAGRFASYDEDTPASAGHHVARLCRAGTAGVSSRAAGKPGRAEEVAPRVPSSATTRWVLGIGLAVALAVAFWAMIVR